MSPTTTTTDPRPLLLAAVAQVTPYVARLVPADLDRPTPCDGWPVRDLLAHLVAVEVRLAHIVRGGHPFDLPSRVDDVADDGWLAAWTAAGEELRVALDEPGVLARTIHHPAGTFPAPRALVAYVSEVLVHGWDLGTALGDTSGLSDDLAAACLEPVRAFLPATPRGVPRVPFGAVVPVAEDARTVDRLAGWYGRDPGWIA